MEGSYGSINSKKLRHFLEKMTTNGDIDLSFELVVGSFFPEIIKNIEAEMERRYNQGFQDALKLKGEANANENCEKPE